MTKGERQAVSVNDGLCAAPRGTWISAGLVTDYLSINNGTHRVPVKWQARRGRGITARVVAYRHRLTDLRVAFGVSVYGPDRFGV